MVTIDGSYREGGGQILRTAVALSAVTGRAVRIQRIRAGRKKPGLRPQHLKGIEGAAAIASATTEGVAAGSREVVFSPGGIREGLFEIDIRTAGSVTLILQQLVPVALFASGPVTLIVKGGTAVPYSPSIEYFRNIMCYYLEEMGVSIFVETVRHGFYPRGGGKVTVTIKPSTITGIDIVERGALRKVVGAAIAAQELKKMRVAERMLEGFREVFPDADSHTAYASTASSGCFLSSHARYERSKIGADGLGQKGKRAEDVGRETAVSLRDQMHAGGVIDCWMVDQLIVYLGLAAHFSAHRSRVAISGLTSHAETTIWVTSQLLSVRFEIENGILHAIPRSCKI
jgi:RNA 3'-phosphate cyclase